MLTFNSCLSGQVSQLCSLFCSAYREHEKGFATPFEA